MAVLAGRHCNVLTGVALVSQAGTGWNLRTAASCASDAHAVTFERSPSSVTAQQAANRGKGRVAPSRGVKATSAT